MLHESFIEKEGEPNNILKFIVDSKLDQFYEHNFLAYASYFEMKSIYQIAVVRQEDIVKKPPAVKTKS